MGTMTAREVCQEIESLCERRQQRVHPHPRMSHTTEVTPPEISLEAFEQKVRDLLRYKWDKR
jgi:hypothetical protein